jgi:hypothetical protein
MPRSPIIAAGIFLALTIRAPAESPRDELLRMVPDDAGFCLVVEGLRDQAARLADSPFVRQFRQSPTGALLNADRDWQTLTAGREKLEALLGLEWTKLRDDVLGDALVFAYRPSLADGPQRDQVLILVRARDPQALAKLVEWINAFQKVSGEVKAVEAREHGGLRYFQRVEAKAAPFYALLGPVLAVSSDEAMLRDALDRRSHEPATEPLLARGLRQLLGTQQQLASLWINPRAFDAAVAAKAEQGRDDQKAIAKNFLAYWKALDAAALGVGVQDDFTLTLAARARTEELPPAARRFLASAADPSEAWRRFPDNALFAFAGRFDASAFVDVLGEFLTPQTRRALRDGLDRYVGAALDKDVLQDVLPCLGPDFGVCVVAPEAGSKSWLPHAVLALRVRPGEKLPHLDQALFSAVNALAQAAVIDHNSKHAERMVLKTTVQDKVEVKYLAGAAHFPPGLQPAFALKDGYLVLASSPDALRRFAPVKELPAGEVPVLRISIVDLRNYLQTYRRPLVAALAAQNETKQEEVERHLDGLLSALQLFDKLEINQRVTAGQAAVTLRVRTAQSLRK